MVLVQVHGPLGQNFFWPGSLLASVLCCGSVLTLPLAGKMIKIVGTVEQDLYEEYASSVANSNSGSKLPSQSELQVCSSLTSSG